MSGTASTTAIRLLDAHVEWALTELSEPRLPEVVERLVADVFDIAATATVAAVADPAEVKNTLLVAIDETGDSPVIRAMAQAFADAIYDLAAAEEHRLGDVVDRAVVDKLLTKALAMRQLQDRALERLTESPVVASVASAFVNKLVTDFLAANRARAERIPGVGSVLAVGDRITDAVRGTADRRLGQVIGDVTAGAAQYALRHTTNAIRELLDNAPLHDAAMELWDLHAGEPMSGLRAYLTREDLRELVGIALELVITTRNKGYIGAVIDECVDVFFAHYGEHTVAALLDELGVNASRLTDEIVTHAPSVLAAARRDGVLAAKIRAQLEPFYASDAVARILAEG